MTGGSYGESQVTLDLDHFGKVTIPLPDASVRIVGFKVAPRSVPNTIRC